MEQVLTSQKTSEFEEESKEEECQKSMDEEMNSIRRNNTRDLVELPKGKDAIAN